ncbi:MAG: glycosyltransferase family 39 protein [Bdellovibrionales bacterium]|nr:glycosyltransferase family 39 protein [Bdellovibrionales bacterium]
MNNLSSRYYWGILYTLLLITTLAYSYGTNVVSAFHNNFVTISYILVLFVIFVISCKRTVINREAYLYLGLIPIIYLGIYLGVYLSGADESVIWMPDSYRVHLLQSQSLLHRWNLLKLPATLDERYLSFHFVSAIVFSLFGVNIYSGGVILFIGKLLTGVFIYKFARKLFDSQIAAVALLVYILVPTVLFYSIVFYKEVYVHLFVIMVYYFAYEIFYLNKMRAAIPLLLSLLLLFNERFYLASFFIANFVVFSIFYTKNRLRFVMLMLSVIGGVGVFYFFKEDILNLHSWRNSYNGYSDINRKWNIEIPYCLAFVKILFTPFFTLNKFKLFHNFSYLLIWGSFINQVVILMMVGGGVKMIKKDLKTIIFIFTPFICFLLLFAYVGPAQGRLRDSFYPIISIFAAGFLFEIKRIRALINFN